MSRTPAATLARLKVTYPQWWIGRGTSLDHEPQVGAIHRQGQAPVLTAGSAVELEVLLLEAGYDRHNRRRR
jgi:hypothetical protein